MDYQENLEYEKSIGLIWQRDWEFFFRAADILWAKIAARPDVIERREQHNAELEGFDYNSSDYEINRFSDDLDPICDLIGIQWEKLFDNWVKDPENFIFDDGFAALFLIRVLWANNKVILRGHYNNTWTLISTLSRAKMKGDNYLKPILFNADRFIDKISQSKFIQKVYGNSIPDSHKQAILQHYGFPTELLDCTYSYDVALFFAEGGKDSLPLSDLPSEFGAIYAFPSHILSQNAILVSLPPAIMRTALQRGVFVSNLSSRDIERLEKYKFTFRHKRLPVWNGIGDIRFGAPIGMSRYLMPTLDPIELVAEPLRNFRDLPESEELPDEATNIPSFGETPEGVWFIEVMENCIRERQGGRQTIDMNLLVHMCKNEPPSALVALQKLATQIEKLLMGKPVAQADKFAINLRLIIGAMMMAYMISQNCDDGSIPKELLPILRRHPVIVDCANFVGSYNNTK